MNREKPGNTRRPPLRALVLFVLLAAASCGCGYTAESQYRKGIRTVAVPIWTRGKDVYRREVEIRLTEALIKRIELDTPYKVTGKKRADTLLSGSIERIEQATLSFNPDTGQPREIQVKFTIAFRWEDLRTGKVLVSRTNFHAATVYLPPRPFNEDFFRGSEALTNILARRIVETMEEDWGGF